MRSFEAYPSLSELGDRIGDLSERHLDMTFRLLKEASIQRNEDFFCLITGEMHPLGNIAIARDRNSPAATAAALKALSGCRAPSTLIYLGLPVGAEVEEVLERHGFQNVETMPAMAVDLEQLAHSELPEGYDLVRIGEGSEAEDWTECLAVGYELPRKVAHLFSPASLGAEMGEDAGLQFFAVVKAGRVVSTSMMSLQHGLAGIYCVATLAEERRRGLGACLTAEPLHRARRLGYRTGVLQSTAMGRSVYRRLGFVECGNIPLYVRMPG